MSYSARCSAENFPLINNQEREEIGIRYKNLGQDEAIRLGHELVQGEIKSERIRHWQDFFKQYPQGVLYCFRGGMRSKITQQWIYEQTGVIYPRVKGGYKAMRNYLLSRLEPESISSKPVILGGRTGSGKTRLLNSLANSIDLEGLANHRGSTFGRFTTPQPGQADFENRLAAALTKHGAAHHSHLLLEDEGRHVGKRFLPKELAQFFNSGDLVVLEVDFEERWSLELPWTGEVSEGREEVEIERRVRCPDSGSGQP